jgi:hypothetical protein
VPEQSRFRSSEFLALRELGKMAFAVGKQHLLIIVGGSFGFTGSATREPRCSLIVYVKQSECLRGAGGVRRDRPR